MTMLMSVVTTRRSLTTYGHASVPQPTDMWMLPLRSPPSENRGGPM
jgi:hypothetical protein